MTIQTDLSIDVAADVLRDDRLGAFVGRLSQTNQKRIPLKAIWQAFAEVWPRHPQGVEGRQWMIAVLERLAEQGTLRLPSGRGKRWDRTSAVPLPLSVDLVVPRRLNDSRRWRQFPWHPVLQWVLELPQLTSQQEQFLLQVHRGLTEGWFNASAPFKYRSLQLTGDEKAMQNMVASRLFEPARLTLAMIGCQLDTTPIAWEAVGEAPRMVMFENAGSFLVALATLKNMPKPPYGMVGYGGGECVLNGLAYLRLIGRPIEVLHYVGDLDRKGITIGMNFQRRAAESDMMSVRAESQLHAAMLRSAANLGAANGWPAKSRRVALPEGDLAFLHPEHRDQVNRMLAHNHRIPEEVLDEAALREAWR